MHGRQHFYQLSRVGAALSWWSSTHLNTTRLQCFIVSILDWKIVSKYHVYKLPNWDSHRTVHVKKQAYFDKRAKFRKMHEYCPSRKRNSLFESSLSEPLPELWIQKAKNYYRRKRKKFIKSFTCRPRLCFVQIFVKSPNCLEDVDTLYCASSPPLKWFIPKILPQSRWIGEQTWVTAKWNTPEIDSVRSINTWLDIYYYIHLLLSLLWNILNSELFFKFSWSFEHCKLYLT